MIQAGCPLGYDTGVEQSRGLGIEERARNWIVNGRVGLSSKAIWSHMMGADSAGHFPHDPADLNRCLLLLDLIPEWKPRMGEMAAHGPVWARLSARWGEIEACFLDEAGLDGSKSGKAPKTYRLMKEVIAG